ncbi:hypothetical protein FRC06_000438 [Ceratobasidium sp. 370]|nr:hypothetical protein FRC06_000438 [Ceratobasidium sp. 370]
MPNEDQFTTASHQPETVDPPDLNDTHTRMSQRTEGRSQLATLDQSVAHWEQIIQLSPDGHPEKRTSLFNMGGSLCNRYQCTRRLSDLDRAIACFDQVLAHNPGPGRNTRHVVLATLANALQDRFEALEESPDADKAISCQEDAVRYTPEGHSIKPSRLALLSYLLRQRFLRLGSPDDFNDAIACLNDAVALATPGHGDVPQWLSVLSSMLLTRYENQGSTADLDKAIDSLEKAISLAPNEDSMPIWLGDLGNLFSLRFELAGALSDIHRAIDTLNRATQAMPEEHPNRPEVLNMLAIAHTRRFDCLGEPADIDEAIDSHDSALLPIPDDDPNKPSFLNNLGNSLQSRFENRGNVIDLDRAIVCHSRAKNLTPQGDPNLVGRLNNLSLSLRLRFEALGGLLDLQHAIEAITYLGQALSLTPEDDTRRAGWANTLGNALYNRFRHQGNPLDLEQSTKIFREAARSTQGDPWSRFDAACNWARLSPQNEGSARLGAYALVMSLVPSVIWMGNMLKNRYRDVTLVGGVVMEAVAAAIEHNAYDLAVEWLEEGRSIVWKQKLQILTPMDDLRRVKPELADQLAYIAFHIGLTDTVNMVPHNANPHEDSSQRYRRLAEGWDKLLQEARLVDGFDNFLLPKKLPQLLKAAHSGAVALVNVHEKHCDVLLLQPNSSEVIHLPLPNFSYKLATRLRDQLFRLLRHGDLRIRSVRRPVFHVEEDDRVGFQDILATLWSGVVEPVLDRLGYLKPLPVEQPPRLTWCATGPLSFLPLHAAGRYDTPGSENRTFSYVVTSYTPTLDSLIRRAPPAHGFSGVLAVGLSSTVGQPPLPGTVQEIDNIAKHAGSFRFKRLVEDDATVGSILEAMGKYSWIHFACHASQDLAEPTSSAFYLHDRPLDLAAITWKTRPNADFAFLSACQTALGDEGLPDEWVHLAGAMSMTGYSSLIASMWSIHDQYAPLVADHVYAALFEGGAADSSRACRALHEAMRHLRMHVGENDFSAWVPFIHVGL